MPFVAVVIINFRAVFVEFRLPSPAVFEAMEINTHPLFLEGFQLAEKIKHAAVIQRVGYIMTDDM